ncbi:MULTISPECIES: siderophore-interacting protein [unclassified Rhizobium]|uniref:siderophore-interacting protein n=1 Tax=unclassified Rhizobium TaxID=2613769 RepID=UPI0017876F98|nr:MULTISPECIES: siderophore-interacting protein [unclassified Rhizobium]MBD8689877.1 siderophore-interacting protein [Rhizobium sp. CFBP 13644]MBD8694467.1 siderophore-interacting protein [Rhizobium sp. CFBP 13717]
MQTTTLLDVSPALGFQIIKDRALERSLRFEESAGGLILDLPFGQICATEEKSGLRLTLYADDQMKLHLLQEAVDHRLDEAAMAPQRQWSLSRPGIAPPNLTFTTVESCDRIYPSYYRLRLSGPSLERFSRDGLHFRLLFPPESHLGQWPFLAESGRVEWPGGISHWHRPVYTTRTVDLERGTLDFDVFAHDGGRVTRWCSTLSAGAEVAIMGPGGEWLTSERWIAFFGDETALPAIARILQDLAPETEGIATILTSDAGDKQDLHTKSNVSIRWLVRGDGICLIHELKRLQIPDNDRLVWFAGERSEVNQAREILGSLGLRKDEIRAASYWTR